MKPNEFSFAFGVLYVVAGLIVATKPDVIVDNYPLVLSGDVYKRQVFVTLRGSH